MQLRRDKKTHSNISYQIFKGGLMKSSILLSGIMMGILLLIGCDNSTSVEDSSICGDIEGQYIVVFNEYWQEKRTSEVAEEVQTFTNQFLSDYEIPTDSVIARFELVLRGFTARIDEVKAKALMDDYRVKYVEQNKCAKLISFLQVVKQKQVAGKS